MSANAYELLALMMRYVFAALIFLIVLRAWFGASVDSQRAVQLRKLSPDTGIIGELLVTEGGERARPGMRYPLTLEGTIGSGRRADIRVRHHSVRARHAIYQMTDEGLFVRSHANKRLGTAAGYPARELLLQDGGILRVGDVALMLVLTDGGNPVPEAHRGKLRRHFGRDVQGDAEVLDSGMDEDDPLFQVGPAPARSVHDEYDEYDEF